MYLYRKLKMENIKPTFSKQRKYAMKYRINNECITEERQIPSNQSKYEATVTNIVMW